MNSIEDEEKDPPMPSKLELASELMSVDRILEQTIEKMKVSLLMCRMVAQPKPVILRLSGTAYKSCADMLQAYVNKMKKTQGEKPRRVIPPHEDHELMHLIDTFQENSKMVKYFNDWVLELPKEAQESINELCLLRGVAKERFNAKAVAQLEEEKEILVIYGEYLDTLKNLKTLDNIMAASRVQSRWRSVARRSTTQSSSLQASEGTMEMKTMRELAREECIARINPRVHAERKKHVQDDLDVAKSELQKTMKTNLADESIARSEHNKWQIQLQALIKKYDSHMLEKFKEKLSLEKKYVDTLAEHEKFVKNVYTPTEKIYENIVKAKKLKEDEIWQQKVLDFIMNRSARVIQRAFRRYLRIHQPQLWKKFSKGRGKYKGK